MHRVAMWHLHRSTLFSSEPKLPEALVMSAMMLLLLQQMMLLWMLLLMLLLMCVRQAATRWHVTKNSQEQPQTHIQGPPNGWVSYRKIQYGDGGSLQLPFANSWRMTAPATLSQEKARKTSSIRKSSNQVEAGLRCHVLGLFDKCLSGLRTR